MAAWAAATRQAANLARSSSPTAHTASSLVHRRGMASGSDHHGPPKVNFWQDPMNPSRWKAEHLVLVSLTGCGFLVYGGYKFFTRGKKDNTGEKFGEAPR